MVLGGPEPANYAAEYLSAGADAIVNGEGEVSLEALLRADGFFARSRDSVSAGGGVVRTESRAADCGSGRAALAGSRADRYPAIFERLARAARAGVGFGDHGARVPVSLPVVQPFGVWENASAAIAGGVAEEVAWIVERYQPEMLWMADDVFTIHPGWIVKYAEEMRRRGLRVPFECITRADRMNVRMAGRWRSWGVFACGSDRRSGSQKILDAMQRGVRVDQVREAVRLLREHGIETGMFLMWGYEGEDLGDIEATVEHVKTCRPDVFLTTVSYPIKGTPYYEDVSARLVRIGEWTPSTDREVRIERAAFAALLSVCGSAFEKRSGRDGCRRRSGAARVARNVCGGGGVMLAAERQRFLDDYLRIRRAEGRGSDDPAYYLALPYRDLSGALSAQWEMRGTHLSIF